MKNFVKLGPKEMSGTKWDVSDIDVIQQILISHEKNTINSIQFAYVIDGDMFLSPVYGQPTGFKFDTITFGFLERLVSVSGEYDENGLLVSVAFRTNVKTYGPFGGSNASDSAAFEKFNYNFGPSVSFGGFHGSVHDSCVAAIGVYVRPLAGVDNWDDDVIVTRE